MGNLTRHGPALKIRFSAHQGQDLIRKLYGLGHDDLLCDGTKVAFCHLKIKTAAEVRDTSDVRIVPTARILAQAMQRI